MAEKTVDYNTPSFLGNVVIFMMQRDAAVGIAAKSDLLIFLEDDYMRFLRLDNIAATYLPYLNEMIQKADQKVIKLIQEIGVKIRDEKTPLDEKRRLLARVMTLEKEMAQSLDEYQEFWETAVLRGNLDGRRQ